MSDGCSEDAPNQYSPTMGVCIQVFALLICLAGTFAQAHDTPTQLPVPLSKEEAWNVIEQSKANIDQLLDANLMRDVAAQLANLSGALRYLRDVDPPSQDLSGRLLSGEIELLSDSRAAVDPRQKTGTRWSEWRKELSQLEALYPEKMRSAEIYMCPMHPLDRHLKVDERCTICGMALVRRHLPASGVYQKPGESTLKIAATCPALVVGQPVTVILHLSKADGSPVHPNDLIETHTQKIHLLINDRSLSDYHHEHPRPTATQGEYRFSFTPQRPGPYRIWADLVPAARGVQEYDIVDLPAFTTPQLINDRTQPLSTTVQGLHFDLAFDTAGQPLHAGQTIVGTLAVTQADGKGFTSLEPVMGAFAHLVGFCDDGKTILHIHPYGKEPALLTDRAGPGLAFKFYAPVAGMIKLYCQVRIAGADVFVPFTLKVAP